MTAPAPILQPPDSRMLRTVAAGKWAVQINSNTDSTATPAWVWVNGISKWEPKFDAQMEDDSDIYGDNYKSEVAAGNGFSVDVEGMLKFVEAGVTDPGLAILLAKAEETGFDNYAHIRCWRRDEVPRAYDFIAAVKITESGGKPNELQKWTGSLSGRGRPTNITKPTPTP